MSTIVKDRPKTDLSTVFIPVIFANGEDDDTLGLIAAIKNEAVLYDEHVYAPGEAMEITHKTLVISKGLFVVGSHVDAPPIPEGWVMVREGEPGRKLHVEYCHFKHIGNIPLGPIPPNPLFGT